MLKEVKKTRKAFNILDYKKEGDLISWESMPEKGVVIIKGHRATGKSSLAWWFAQVMQKRTTKKVAAFGMPVEARKNFPQRGFGRGGIQYVDNLKEVSLLKPSIIICDDPVLIDQGRNAITKQNNYWLNLIAICGLRDHLLIFIHNQFGNRELNSQILIHADLVFIKQLSKLHFRTRNIFKEAATLFSQINGDAKKKVYVVDVHKGSKMLNANMPIWWSNKTSKSYGFYGNYFVSN